MDSGSKKLSFKCKHCPKVRFSGNKNITNVVIIYSRIFLDIWVSIIIDQPYVNSLKKTAIRLPFLFYSINKIFFGDSIIASCFITLLLFFIQKLKKPLSMWEHLETVHSKSNNNSVPINEMMNDVKNSLKVQHNIHYHF